MDRDSLLALIGKLEKWALFFGILVAIGVAGESVYGIRLYWNNRKLQEIQNREAEKQRETIAQLDNETAKLESIVAGRNLKPEEIDAIAKSCRQFAGHAILMTSYTGDAEGARLAMQIQAALERAGLQVANNIGRLNAEEGGVLLGVGISGPVSDRDIIFSIAKSLTVDGHLTGVTPQAVEPPSDPSKFRPLAIGVGLRPFSPSP